MFDTGVQPEHTHRTRFNNWYTTNVILTILKICALSVMQHVQQQHEATDVHETRIQENAVEPMKFKQFSAHYTYTMFIHTM